MKKKIVSLFLASMMLMSMASCSKEKTDESKKEKSSETTVETVEETEAVETESSDAPAFREGYLVDYPFSNGSVMSTKVSENANATFENADGCFVAHIENGGSEIKDVYAYYGKFDIVKDVDYTLSFKVSTDVNTQVKIMILGEDGKTFCQSATVPLYPGEGEYSFGFSHFDDLPNATLYIFYGNNPDEEMENVRNVSFSELYLFETPEN